MPNDSQLHVPGVEVILDGAKLKTEYQNLVTEVRVRSTLALPDSATVRLVDPQGDNIDALITAFAIGKSIEIKTSAPAAKSTSSIFKGQCVAFEPNFGKEGAEFTARALDKGHKLQRVRKVRTFQQVSAADMVKKVASENGLTAKVNSTTVVHEFFQQSAETDWDFCWRLARMHGYRLFVADNDLVFQPAETTSGAAINLKWQETLVSFRPRVSGIQQLDSVSVRSWDPTTKRNVSGQARGGTATSAPALARSKVASDSGGGTTLIADRVAFDGSEADDIAKSALNGRADAYVEAEGVAFGNPSIRAGANVTIQGVGTNLSGTYYVTATDHTYRGKTGYMTGFQISGRSPRGLLDLLHPPAEPDWARDLVVGIVTNNNDPDQAGRVRVKYPTLSDSEESAWARVASVSAGNQRGLMMLPQPDEEVIVGFEQGDTRRPIVLGSLFNGKDKPGQELLQNRDGSFAVVSNEKGFIHTKKDLEIKSDQKMVVDVQSDQTSKVAGNMTHETTGSGKLKAQQYTLEAGSTLSVKGVSVTVEASASLTLKGATVDVQASGPLNLKGAIINIG
jgi:phage protein D